jgi:5-methylcytosine-specific restriction enzyme subunit McrC
MIRIQNIYYMLAYAFQILKEQGYSNVATEEFENTADLLSAILVKGISIQIKRGLSREYVEEIEVLSGLRGKIDVTDSIKKQTLIQQRLVCNYDEFSVDSYKNQIIKTTAELLMRYDIPLPRKKELRNLMLYFKDVKTLDPYSINWNIQYNRNNQTYRMLISICYLVIKGLLQTTSNGQLKLMTFLDEQRMCRLYEKFILEYFKKEYPQIKTAASQIDWALDDGIGTMLPTMQSDIMLSYEGRTLIIDAKYYSHTTQVQYDVHKLHSNNLYQIFTYVKNKAVEGGSVSGMLLYAKTDEEIQPNQQFKMSGNTICVRTLDLDCDFTQVSSQLNNIADAFIEGKI